MDERAVIEATRRWIATVVIGLNLCPFARRVFAGGLDPLRRHDAANDPDALLGDLAAELTAWPRAAIEQSRRRC